MCACALFIVQVLCLKERIYFIREEIHHATSNVVCGPQLYSSIPHGWNGIETVFTQINEYVSVLSPYWQSRHYYPCTNCVLQPGNVPRYNCDLNFQYCHIGYMGRYRCDVTNKETGKTISRSLRLRGMCFISCSNCCAKC